MIGNMKQFFYVLPVKKREGEITTKNKWRSRSYPLLEELYLLGFCLLALSSRLSSLCYILTTYSLILAGRVNLLLWVPQVIALCPSKEGLRQTPRSCIDHFPVTMFPIIGKLRVVLFDMLGDPSSLWGVLFKDRHWIFQKVSGCFQSTHQTNVFGIFFIYFNAGMKWLCPYNNSLRENTMRKREVEEKWQHCLLLHNNKIFHIYSSLQ